MPHTGQMTCPGEMVIRPAGSAGSVGQAMVRHPKRCPAGTTVEQARTMFGDDHVHALLIVERDRLLAVVERGDLVGADPQRRAAPLGRLGARCVDPGTDLIDVWGSMLTDRRRRLAVVDAAGRLLGLLCLKRSGKGFCTDAGIRARAAERRGCGPVT